MVLPDTDIIGLYEISRIFNLPTGLLLCTHGCQYFILHISISPHPYIIHQKVNSRNASIRISGHEGHFFIAN